MAAHDKAFSRGAGLLSALASAGGLDALSSNMRPSTRRPSKTAAEVEDVEDTSASGEEGAAES